MVRTRFAAAPFALAAAAVLPGQQQAVEFPDSMDFGPCLTTTLVARGLPGATMKALVVRLGDDGAAAFDTETLRLSALWTDGWLDLRGTAYDGSHGPMPGIRGHVLAATVPGPGFAHDGDFADPRQQPYGPLPRAWGTYAGHWLCGDRVVAGYRLGAMEVKESWAIERLDGTPFGARHFEFGPCDSEQTLVVLDTPNGAEPGTMEWTDPALKADVPTAAFALLHWQPRVPEPVEIDVSWTGWDHLAMGGPSALDWLDKKSGTGATVRYVPGFRRTEGHDDGTQPVDAAAALLLPQLHDGEAAARDGERRTGVAFEGGDGAGRLHVDPQRCVDVSRVSTYSWHGGEAQQYELFAHEGDTPVLDAKDLVAAGWRSLGSVRTRDLGSGGKHGASVARKVGLGRARHLLLVVRGTARLCEIDVWADTRRAPVDASERLPVFSAAAVKGEPGVAALKIDGTRMLLVVPAHKDTVRCKLLLSQGGQRSFEALGKHLAHSGRALDLGAAVKEPNRHRWGQGVAARGQRAPDDEAWVADTVAIPFENPFGSHMRVCGFDFFRDGRAAITTWNGDVWIVDGLDADLQQLRWTRFATGLYDPLGLRIVDDVVYVHGRDGITRLHDRDGDGEADRYECFNHDIAVTNAFHEFAFDLQTDAAGNFYGSKGGPVNPGGRGFMAIAAHHGTIFKVAHDGSSLEVFASGLRAPNGIGVSPDGIVTSGDNEGTWMPRCRLNWITAPGYYAGVRDTAHRQPVPDKPDLPLCWMPMEIDNSSGSQCWVSSDAWGPLQGRLLHLSYGTCSIYLVLKEEVDGVVQGGVVRLPVNLSSSAMRARFHPKDGQLYVAGFQGWQTSAARLGGFHRIRWTGKAVPVPVGLRTCERGVYLTFLVPLDEKTAADAQSFGVEIWDYLYSQNYGSPEVSILHPERKVEQGKPNRDALKVTAATLSPDKRTVFLAVDGMRPAMQMRIAWNLDGGDGAQLKGELHNTIHALPPDPGFPAEK